MLTVEAVRNGNQTPRDLCEEPNEILRYVETRYISPVEACIELFGFPIQAKTHAVIKLNVHLEGYQLVLYQSDDDPEEVLQRGGHTTLPRYFELCASDAPENQVAKTMLYQDIPKEFAWKEKCWSRRKRYQAAIGRMVHVSPRDVERFYIRFMLCHRRGATSFEDLRTVNGQVCATYRDAALQAGYLEHDGEWVSCMTEASAIEMPYQLRQLFATILVYSMPTDVKGLWGQFYGELSRDYEYQYRELKGEEKENMVKFQTLKSLQELLEANGSGVHQFSDLPQLSEFPDLLFDSLRRNSLLDREQHGYDEGLLMETVAKEDQLNQGQKVIYDTVVDAVDNPEPGNKLFFIDGPGGTGKSTLLRHILAKVRLSGKIAIALASSGIASLLLMGGRTAHSTFKIPLNVDEHSTCGIKKRTHLQELLKEASLIIWDEAPMTHRHAFEAVDRTLQDILNSSERFGGKVVVLSGDFRQILPVVKGGTPAETINPCLKSSVMWGEFTQLKLKESMRVKSAENEADAAELEEFANFLLQVGEGRHDVNPLLGQDYMKIPSDMGSGKSA